MDYEIFNKGCLEEAKRLYKTANADQRYILEKLFPELAESEDKKIRKELITYLKSDLSHKPYGDKFIESWIAWLARQGELVNSLSKGLDNAHERIDELIQKNNELCIKLEKQGEQKSADSYCQENCKGFQETGKCFADGMCKAKREAESLEKAEPKFKIGNWIVDKYGLTQQVLDFRGGIYTCTYNSFTTDCENNYHLWNIKDAKHGDVLAYDTVVLIFDHLGTFENRPIIYSWYFADSKKFYGMGTSDPDRWEVEGFYPATKEQRDLLFRKMNEAGYEWDAENKELKAKHDVQLTEFEEAVKDLMNDYRDAIGDNDATIEEIKNHAEYMLSLIRQKPAEWSENDEEQLDRAIYMMEQLDMTKSWDDVYNWLKSIKQRIRG